MSAVVQFPSARVTEPRSAKVVSVSSARRRLPRQSTTASALHDVRGGNVVSILSWVRATACDCCGRPTLHGHDGPNADTLCGDCTPPNAA